MASRSIQDYRARNEDAPLDLLLKSETWKPLVSLINGWAKEALSSESGYSPQELDKFAWRQGVSFPPVLREWWRLAGRHPFVSPGLMSENASFLSPHHRGWSFHRDLFAIAVDDIQTQNCNGIHFDFLSDLDPEVHGMNSTVTPEHDPDLNWYKNRFIGMRLRVPSLVFVTLLYHLFTPNPLVRDGVVYLEVDRGDTRGSRPDERLMSGFGLQLLQSPNLVGDIYYNGADVIYWWFLGCVCKSADAAERVLKAVPTRLREA